MSPAAWPPAPAFDVSAPPSDPVPLPEPDDAVQWQGPWTHRNVAANGARFHVVEMGEGPLVLLLHGFPTYWWTWRRLLAELAGAGYRAVAMDLRGYGGSDHTPHGYDPMTLSADVAGVVRSLGAADAVVVGQGWGGLLAWSVSVMHPNVVRGIVPVSCPHPMRLRDAMRADRAQRRAARYVYGFQVPLVPERRLTEHDAAKVGAMLRSWSAFRSLARRRVRRDVPRGDAHQCHRPLRA